MGSGQFTICDRALLKNRNDGFTAMPEARLCREERVGASRMRAYALAMRTINDQGNV